MDFFEDCIFGSEESERERYTNIYFSVKEHLNDSKRCFTDGTSHVYDSNIDPDEIDMWKQYDWNNTTQFIYFKANVSR